MHRRMLMKRGKVLPHGPSRKPLQLYGSHLWLLRGIAALSRTKLLTEELPIASMSTILVIGSHDVPLVL